MKTGRELCLIIKFECTKTELTVIVSTKMLVEFLLNTFTSPVSSRFKHLLDHSDNNGILHVAKWCLDDKKIRKLIINSV